MASELKNLSEIGPRGLPDASGNKIGVVVSEWNTEITSALAEGCIQTLEAAKVASKNIHRIDVPGAFELTVGAKMLLKRYSLDAVICIGCVIKGETSHNEYINQSVAQGLTTLGVASGVPCIFGLLTPNDEQQAKDRSGGKHGNKGIEAAYTALWMANTKANLQDNSQKIGF